MVAWCYVRFADCRSRLTDRETFKLAVIANHVSVGKATACMMPISLQGKEKQTINRHLVSAEMHKKHGIDPLMKMAILCGTVLRSFKVQLENPREVKNSDEIT